MTQITEVTQAEVLTKRLKSTIVDWYYLCRDVAVAEFQKLKKMECPGLVVQIDESLFQNKGNIIVEDYVLEIANPRKSDEDEYS